MLKDFSHKLFKNIARTFKGSNFAWHLLAIVITYLLVISGSDWRYFEFTAAGWPLSIRMPAGLLGFLVPLFLPIGFYLLGKIRGCFTLKNTGAALGQAAFVGWFITSSYKALTGRLHPELVTNLSNTDISGVFNFGFFKEGIFWGWPSSHTAVAFAMAAALYVLYPNHKKITVLFMLYAAFIGLGVSVGIHWLSDVIAGVIIGTVAGLVVAKSYKERKIVSE